MTSEEVLSLFQKTGGYVTDSHIVLTSGKHTTAYLNKDAIYPHTREISLLCREIAERFKDADIQVVAAPALGGIILSQWTAHHLDMLTQREVLAVYTEKMPDKNQVFTRGYDQVVKGKKVLVVEDITTTGGSVMKVVNSVKEAGGEVVSICVVANRNPDEINTQALGVPYMALAEIRIQAWEETDCPLCKQGVPVNTTVGKGREFLEKKGK